MQAVATLRPDQAASILLDRRRCRSDLEAFASRVPVPGSPATDAAEDARIPLIETTQAAHHKLILREMQRCMQTAHGRLMVMAPPGSAKSTYASVVSPTWYLGTQPDRRVILASYGDDLARNQVKSARHRGKCHRVLNPGHKNGQFIGLERTRARFAQKS